jgi:hypothetical protein
MGHLGNFGLLENFSYLTNFHVELSNWISTIFQSLGLSLSTTFFQGLKSNIIVSCAAPSGKNFPALPGKFSCPSGEIFRGNFPGMDGMRDRD